MTTQERQFQSAKMAEYLLSIDAVQLNILNPYTWSSGWRSPIYCDNRLTLGYPAIRKFITEAFIGLLSHYYPLAEGIAGVATAGIAHGVLLADGLGLPYSYVRGSAKEHGRKNQIEGIVKPGQKIVVIEDLLSTGGSTIEVIKVLKAAGAEVLGALAIFTYQFPQAEENFAMHNTNFQTITDYSALLQVAVSKGLIAQTDLASLDEWRRDPAGWNPTNF